MRIRKSYIFCVLLLLFMAAGILLPLAVQTSFSPAKTGVTFVLDAGHGGEDGGAVSADGLKESDVNLAVTLRLEQLLLLFGREPVLTRSSDSIAYPPEASTVRARKQADLDLRLAKLHSTPNPVLVSIHQNRYGTESPHGAQVFFGMEPGSEAFAIHTQNQLLALGENKRLATAMPQEIYLIRNAACPAILVECGFLSNPVELAALRTEPYRTKVALCLLSACLSYETELEKLYGQA